jgi:hypothetical protein
VCWELADIISFHDISEIRTGCILIQNLRNFSIQPISSRCYQSEILITLIFLCSFMPRYFEVSEITNRITSKQFIAWNQNTKYDRNLLYSFGDLTWARHNFTISTSFYAYFANSTDKLSVAIWWWREHELISKSEQAFKPEFQKTHECARTGCFTGRTVLKPTCPSLFHFTPMRGVGLPGFDKRAARENEVHCTIWKLRRANPTTVSMLDEVRKQRQRHVQSALGWDNLFMRICGVNCLATSHSRLY